MALQEKTVSNIICITFKKTSKKIMRQGEKEKERRKNR